MASSSLDNNPARGYFRDLHGFKDFVGMVSLCAPDQFLYEEGHTSDDQLNLDRAFAGLRYGLDLTAKEKGESPRLEKCRQLVTEAYIEYQAGRNREGYLKLDEMKKLLRKIPSE